MLPAPRVGEIVYRPVTVWNYTTRQPDTVRVHWAPGMPLEGFRRGI